LLGPGNQRAVAGDLIVLDCLRSCRERSIENLLVLGLANGERRNLMGVPKDRRLRSAFAPEPVAQGVRQPYLNQLLPQYD
jgi:hypothetical protein